MKVIQGWIELVEPEREKTEGLRQGAREDVIIIIGLLVYEDDRRVTSL